MQQVHAIFIVMDTGCRNQANQQTQPCKHGQAFTLAAILYQHEPHHYDTSWFRQYGIRACSGGALLRLLPSTLTNDVDEHQAIDPASVRRRALMQSLWFVSGFSLVSIALGVLATLLMHMDVLGKIAGAIIIQSAVKPRPSGRGYKA